MCYALKAVRSSFITSRSLKKRKKKKIFPNISKHNYQKVNLNNFLSKHLFAGVSRFFLFLRGVRLCVVVLPYSKINFPMKWTSSARSLSYDAHVYFWLIQSFVYTIVDFLCCWFVFYKLALIALWVCLIRLIFCLNAMWK